MADLPESSSNKLRKFVPSERTRARICAMKALYQYFVSGADDVDHIKWSLAEDPDYLRCNKDYFQVLVDGVFTHLDFLLATIKNYLDRPFSHITPVEKSVITLASFELFYQHTVPVPVVINEAVELAKIYGGTDGYKYVNTILDKMSATRSGSDIPDAAH